MKATSFYKPDKALLKAVSAEIKALRLAKKLTIEQLADLCDLHEKYIQTIERNARNMSISVFVQIAKALSIPPSKLLDKALRSK